MICDASGVQRLAFSIVTLFGGQVLEGILILSTEFVPKARWNIEGLFGVPLQVLYECLLRDGPTKTSRDDSDLSLRVRKV